jgi:hypothetical protein
MSILVLTSDTLIATPATGNVEYNGQFYGTDSNASRAQMQRITQGTAVASTSGTSIDFTGLPAWVKRITVMFQGFSTTGTSVPIIQLGISSGIVATGYLGGAEYAGTAANYTTGIGLFRNWAGTYICHGSVDITLISTNNYVAKGIIALSNTAATGDTGASIALGGVLDRVRITTVGGTDTFDAGSVNIIYEG